MKNKNIVMIVSLVLVCVVLFGILIFHTYEKRKYEKENPITYETTTEKEEPTVLFAEIKDEDIKLFRKGAFVTIDYKGTEKNLSEWNNLITAENSDTYYLDIDNDKKKEVVCRAYAGKEEFSNKDVYDMYIVNIDFLADGAPNITTRVLNRYKAKNVIKARVLQELSQIQSDPDTLQFCMNNDINSFIKYDEKTGVAQTKNTTFIKTPKTKDGKTATLLNWSRGGVYYSVDPKTATITVEIDVLAKFEELEEQQYIGQLKYDMSISPTDVGIKSNSISFTTTDELKAKAPKGAIADVEDWDVLVRNKAYSESAQNNAFEFSAKLNEKTDITVNEKDALSIWRIMVREDKVQVVSKKPFSESTIANKQYSFTVDGENIASKAEVTQRNGFYILEIYFDNEYEKEEISDFTIKFGKQ